jgi:NAD(P)-dependent dehydrogenase (short-subunit alcohol dehydrogenase family)
MSSSLTPPSIMLTGKVAVVTGASKGIGRATAELFAAAGAAVMLSSRKQEALDAVAAGIRAVLPDAEVATRAANAGDPEAADACVSETMERFGRLDVLVNNAATNPYYGPTIDGDLSAFDKIHQVNVRGPLVWAQLAHRASMADHGGSIINVVSVGGIHHGGGIGLYNTSKAALTHLSRVLAAEMGPGVRVNALAPGLVKTDFARVLWEGKEEAVSASLPLRRLGEPIDIANAALFLASDLSSWITGHTLVVDGGSLVESRR